MFISETLIKKIIHELDEIESKILLYRLVNRDFEKDSYKKLFDGTSISEVMKAVCGLKEKEMWEIDDLAHLQELPTHLMKTLPEPVYEWFCSLSGKEDEEMICNLLKQKEEFLRMIEWECEHTLINLDLYVILYLQNELCMSNGLILRLFKQYLKEENYDGLMYQAKNWDELNIRTLETLKWYEEFGWAYMMAIQMVFVNERFSQEDIKRAAYTWGRREKYDLGLVIYACLITKKNVGFVAFPYADTVLSNMRAKNIRSLDELDDSKKCGKLNLPVVQTAKRLLETIFEKEESRKDKCEGICYEQEECPDHEGTGGAPW